MIWLGWYHGVRDSHLKVCLERCMTLHLTSIAQIGTSALPSVLSWIQSLRVSSPPLFRHFVTQSPHQVRFLAHNPNGFCASCFLPPILSVPLFTVSPVAFVVSLMPEVAPVTVWPSPCPKAPTPSPTPFPMAPCCFLLVGIWLAGVILIHQCSRRGFCHHENFVSSFSRQGFRGL
jgi:hypothetical protein